MRVPHPTTLMKITTRCGDDAVAALNEALLVKAAAGKLLRTDKVRADTTVVSADVGYPTDSGLLAQAVGTICRTVGRIKAAGGATRTRTRDRRRSAGRRARSIASKLRLRGAQQRDQAQAVVRRITGELAGIADQAMLDAAAVLRNARRALRAARGPQKGRLRQAINHLDTMMRRTQRVVAQTRSRLAGVMPESATRLVGLHDADAHPIRKGRLGKPVEFGYKAQIVDNADGVILDHSVEIGNPLDAPQLAPAIERIARRAGRSPRAVTADPGYGYASVERDLHALGVRSVAIPRVSKPPRRAPRVRTPACLPRQDQVANGIRRTHQPPQTKLRLEPNRTHRHPGCPNLVRTRRLRPQPGQNQHPRSMTGMAIRSAAIVSHHPTSRPTR